MNGDFLIKGNITFNRIAGLGLAAFGESSRNFIIAFHFNDKFLAW
ncbi:MAG: hypothetical protein UU87_C0003G0134 [Parcubacteria group bacterium GW2011_GWA2_42_11]|nr:MAG: hypothetical protein UU87_C0003G0134 [Parcubacteria group bacterium GW2011_GWA2_42_11]